MFAFFIADSPRLPKTIINGIIYLRVETDYKLSEVETSLEVLIPEDR
jgi:hypothetical protein